VNGHCGLRTCCGVPWQSLVCIRLEKKIDVVWFPLLLVVHSYFWFYMNEARPYAMQIGLGSLLLYSLLLLLQSEAMGTAWAWWLMGAGILLCASTILGVITLAAVILVGGFCLFRKGWMIQRSAFLPLGLLTLSLVTFGGFYLWTLLAGGVGGAKVWQPGWGSVLFSLVEFFGITG
jgi:hypothetical protein